MFAEGDALLVGVGGEEMKMVEMDGKTTRGEVVAEVVCAVKDPTNPNHTLRIYLRHS